MARPGTLYFGLLDVDGTELSGGNYSRVAKTNNATNFPNAAARAKANANTIDWPVANADWVEANSVAIFDAAGAGNELTRGLLVDPVTVHNGESLSIAVGDLDFTLPAVEGNSETEYLANKLLDTLAGGGW